MGIMLYRKFGSDGWEASILGVGCMRLPTSDGIPISVNIVEDEAIAMIRHAIDEGINYLDTAYTYHEGRSEVVLGQALRDGYREKVRIATKSPVWMVEKADDFERFLEEQLERLQVGPIDYYLFHGLSKKRWDTLLEQGLLARAEAAIDDGRILRIGFSFHDAYGAFQEIIDGYDGWSMCQIQYNYMDTENQAGTKGLRYAAARGIPVVVMEPLLGGNLVRPPQDIQEIFDAYAARRTPAAWALQWIWDQPEVAVVLSGMRSMQELEENMLTANGSAERALQEEDRSLITRVRETFESKAAIPCTGCGYCMPCPQGVDIPANFGLYNNGIIYDDLLVSRFRYFRFFGDTDKASACTGCEECEEKCPQDIAISELMPGVHAVLGEGKPYPGTEKN
jgi:predicted aldo/keto reductase-like oxidoreductase